VGLCCLSRFSFIGDREDRGGKLNTEDSETYFKEADFENAMKVTFTNRCNSFILRILLLASV
jgi:hypothetical protein